MRRRHRRDPGLRLRGRHLEDRGRRRPRGRGDARPPDARRRGPRGRRLRAAGARRQRREGRPVAARGRAGGGLRRLRDRPLDLVGRAEGLPRRLAGARGRRARRSPRTTCASSASTRSRRRRSPESPPVVRVAPVALRGDRRGACGFPAAPVWRRDAKCSPRRGRRNAGGLRKRVWLAHKPRTLRNTFIDARRGGRFDSRYAGARAPTPSDGGATRCERCRYRRVPARPRACRCASAASRWRRRCR